MQTIDVVIFSVVITFVSLAMAQNVLLNLSSDPAQVHAIHKIIMVLGLGAAGFSLFLFMADENKGLTQILTVLAIVGIGAFLQKLKKDRQQKQTVAKLLWDEVSGKSESTSTAPQKLDPSEMSVADMLAAARDEVSGKSKATAPPVDEILAHCRKVDG